MKKVSFIHFLGLFVPVLLLAPSAWADVAADLKQAEELRKAGQYAQAEPVYLKVIQEADPNKPADLEAAFNARKKLPLVYLATDRLPQAKEAILQLLSRHAGHALLPHALHEMVEGAKPLYKLPQVRQVCQDLVTSRPDDPQALWLKMTMALASVHQGDYPATDAAIQDLLAAPATDIRVTEALNHVAWACRNVQQPAKGLTIYQDIMEHWPERDQAAFAQHGIVICYQQLGNPQEADGALEVLLQKYGSHKDASKMALWAADGYSSAGEKERARKVFEAVVRNYADTPEAIQAQTAVAIMSIQAEDRARIEAAVQTLLTRFPANETKAQGLHDVANTLVWKKIALTAQPPAQQEAAAAYNRCLQAIANYTQQTWPQSDWALWAERDLAILALRTDNDTDAAAAIRRLMTQYADRKDLPEALYFLASRNLEGGKVDKAEPLFQHLVDKYPDHELVPLAKSGLAQVMIRCGDDQGAETLFHKIMADYRGHPRLADAVCMVCEGYWNQALAEARRTRDAREPRDTSQSAQAVPVESVIRYYRRALEKCEVIIQNLPGDSTNTPFAYHVAGSCYAALGQPRRAIEYYRHICETWPKYEGAWTLPNQIAQMYEQMKQDGVLSGPEVDDLIVGAYMRTLEQYPDSAAGKAARARIQPYQQQRAAQERLMNRTASSDRGGRQ
jgi:tetratricopeptide (TPR) repeat protein